MKTTISIAAEFLNIAPGTVVTILGATGESAEIGQIDPAKDFEVTVPFAPTSIVFIAPYQPAPESTWDLSVTPSPQS